MKTNLKQLMYGLAVIFGIAAVFMYVFSQVDVIPDNIPLFGFLDDAGIVVLAFLLYQRIRHNIKKMGKR